MNAQDKKKEDSIAGLRVDLITAKMLVWAVSVGRDADLTSEAHIYFFDRYQRLAEYHRRHGHDARARRLQMKADEHYQLGGGDGPPYAAAMGMPRPRHWVATDAVSRHHLGGPDDAA
jgi:hypothetical protein